MKKALRIITVSAVICALICVCGLTALGGMSTGIEKRTGYANALKTIRYTLSVSESGDNSLNVFRNECSAGESASCKAMDDFERVEGYSSAAWQVYGEKETRAFVKTLTVGEGVSVIGKNAFRGQSALTTVTLPAGLTEVKDGAFDGCTSVTKILFGGTAEEWEALTIGADNDPLRSAQVVFVKIGDVNLDGEIDVCDSVSVLLYSSGKNSLTNEQKALADFNGDGTVDETDAQDLADYVLKNR